MITKATKEQATEVKNLWKVCFPQEDEGYIDYYFKNIIYWTNKVVVNFCMDFVYLKGSYSL